MPKGNELADLIAKLGELEGKVRTLQQADAEQAKELRYLRDRRDIQDVICRYTRALDRHDWDLFGAVYHDDAIDVHGDFVGTIQDYISHLKIYFKDNKRPHSHNITTHLCEISGDTAHSESYVFHTVQYNDYEVMVGCGRYIDRLERRNGVWKIALRRTHYDWRFRVPGIVPKPGDQAGTFDRTDMSYMRPLAITGEQRARLDARRTGG